MLIIDVRTKQEYDEGHIEGSINIEYGEILNEIENYITDRSAPIGLYCYAGVRSAFALMLIQSIGFSNAANLGCYDVLKTHYAFSEPIHEELPMQKFARQ